MKATLDTHALKRALALAAKATNSRSYPALSYVRATQRGEILHLTATNLDCTLQLALPSPGGEDGEILLPPALLAAVKAADHKAAPTLTLAGDAKTVNLGTATLSTLPPEEFPPDPAPATEPTVGHLTVASAALAVHLASNLPMASTDKGRPVICAVHLAPDGDQLRLVATDGGHLRTSSIPATGTMASCTLPTAACKLLLAALAKENGQCTLEVYTSGERVYLRASTVDWRATLECTSDKYPVWRQVLPDFAPWHRVAMDGPTLTAALAALKPFFGGAGRYDPAESVRWTFAADTLTLHASNPNVGEHTVTLPVNWQHPTAMATFSGLRWLTFLATLPTPDFTLWLKPGDTELSPCVATTGTVTYILMPMRMS